MLLYLFFFQVRVLRNHFASARHLTSQPQFPFDVLKGLVGGADTAPTTVQALLQVVSTILSGEGGSGGGGGGEGGGGGGRGGGVGGESKADPGASHGTTGQTGQTGQAGQVDADTDADTDADGRALLGWTLLLVSHSLARFVGGPRGGGGASSQGGRDRIGLLGLTKTGRSFEAECAVHRGRYVY